MFRRHPGYTTPDCETAAVTAGGTTAVTGTFAPANPPGFSVATKGTSGDASVFVSWNAPDSSGGSPITGYTVTSDPESKTCTSTTTSCAVTGLTNGTSYTFALTATNAAGTGAASSSLLVIPRVKTMPPIHLRGVPDAVVGQPYSARLSDVWGAPCRVGAGYGSRSHQA